jgi:GNAT superfamily N-acetyltransferase
MLVVEGRGRYITGMSNSKVTITIGRPDARTVEKVRAVMPRIFQRQTVPELLVATGEQGNVAGVLYYVVNRAVTPCRLRFWCRVPSNMRRRGVGSQLIEALLAEARREKADRIVALRAVLDTTPAARFLQNLGFVEQHAVEQYEVDLEPMKTLLEPIYRRLQARGRIPSSARMVSLAEAPVPAVRDFVLEHMGGRPVQMMQRLQGQGTSPFETELSRVLIYQGAVAGALIMSRQGAHLDVQILAVEPSLRSGWANAWLKYEAVCGVLKSGQQSVLLSFNPDRHSDTANYLKRLTARSRGQFVRYALTV